MLPTSTDSPHARRAEATQPFAVRRHAAIALLVPPLVHKLNNLLGAAVGFSDLLRQRIDNPRAPELLGSIQSGAEGSVDLIRSLYEFAKPVDAAELRSSLASTDLCALTTRLTALLAPLAETKRVELEPRLRIESANVGVPERALFQRLATLLAEALDSLPDPEPSDPARRMRVTVRRSISSAAGGVPLELSFTAPIGSEVAEVGRGEFQPLDEFEVSALTIREFQGRNERYRTLRFRVPAFGERATSAAPASSLDTPAAPLPAGAPETPNSESQRPARIVLFERDEALGELIATVLVEAGHSVERLDEAVACRARIQAGEFDLLLLDRPAGQWADDGDITESELVNLAREAELRTGARAGVLGTTVDDTPDVLPTLAKPFRPGEMLSFVAANLNRQT